MAYKSKRKQAAAAKRHYLKNKSVVVARASNFKKLARVRNRDFLNEYLKRNPCVDCGEDDTIVLEFDHVRGVKRRNVSDMVNAAFSIAAIEKEIAKCDVRCANCHRRKTFREREKKRGSRI